MCCHLLIPEKEFDHQFFSAIFFETLKKNVDTDKHKGWNFYLFNFFLAKWKTNFIAKTGMNTTQRQRNESKGTEPKCEVNLSFNDTHNVAN
jgi:hypothetical protein